METEPYFCGNQLVQKNCSFFVLGSEQPGQQPAQSRGRVCRAGTGRMPPPWAPSACTVPSQGSTPFTGRSYPTDLSAQTLLLLFFLLPPLLKSWFFWAALQKSPEEAAPHTHHSMNTAELWHFPGFRGNQVLSYCLLP